MTEPGRVRRVGMLAPMTHELEPLARRLDLEGDGEEYRGHAGDVEVVARLTTIGMAAAAAAAERLLGDDVDWVMVVGIAGGVDRALAIGDLVVPAVVVDRASGRSFRAAPSGDGARRGTLSCGDDLIVDTAVLDRMAADGVVAVDMETAAVAMVCEAAERPWSVYRGISDFAGDGVIDDAFLAFTRPDGTSDPDALARYLEDNPERVPMLEQLGRDMVLAAEAAAEAAVRACTNL
jgi:adenosylhomocysteine nucleosidase